jgi:hypothetical protein
MVLDCLVVIIKIYGIDMISIIHWISAKRRLTEAEKTVMMLRDNKFSDAGVPEMVLAQRDFIQKEMEYYYERALNWFFFLILVFGCYGLYWIYVNRIMNNA